LLDFAEVKDLSNAWMVEGGYKLGFIDEHTNDFGVARDFRQDALYCDDTFESFCTLVLGPKYLGHASDIDAIKENVPSKSLWREGRLDE